MRKSFYDRFNEPLLLIERISVSFLLSDSAVCWRLGCVSCHITITNVCYTTALGQLHCWISCLCTVVYWFHFNCFRGEVGTSRLIHNVDSHQLINPQTHSTQPISVVILMRELHTWERLSFTNDNILVVIVYVHNDTIIAQIISYHNI